MKTLVLAPASVFLREPGARPALSRPTLALPGAARLPTPGARARRRPSSS